MRPLASFIVSCVLFLSGCASHNYGKRTPEGTVIKAASFTYSVPVSHLRIHTDESGLIAYEYFGPGMGRGRVFVVRTTTQSPKAALLDDLAQFGTSPARALKDARLVSKKSETWQGRPVQFHLLEIPEISRKTWGEGMKIVDRERMWILGLIVSSSSQRYWISLTSTEMFFREKDGMDEWNREAFMKFAQGLTISE